MLAFAPWLRDAYWQTCGSSDLHALFEDPSSAEATAYGKGLTVCAVWFWVAVVMLFVTIAIALGFVARQLWNCACKGRHLVSSSPVTLGVLVVAALFLLGSTVALFVAHAKLRTTARSDLIAQIPVIVDAAAHLTSRASTAAAQFAVDVGTTRAVVEETSAAVLASDTMLSGVLVEIAAAAVTLHSVSNRTVGDVTYTCSVCAASAHATDAFVEGVTLSLGRADMTRVAEATRSLTAAHDVDEVQSQASDIADSLRTLNDTIADIRIDVHDNLYIAKRVEEGIFVSGMTIASLAVAVLVLVGLGSYRLERRAVGCGSALAFLCAMVLWICFFVFLALAVVDADVCIETELRRGELDARNETATRVIKACRDNSSIVRQFDIDWVVAVADLDAPTPPADIGVSDLTDLALERSAQVTSSDATPAGADEGWLAEVRTASENTLELVARVRALYDLEFANATALVGAMTVEQANVASLDELRCGDLYGRVDRFIAVACTDGIRALARASLCAMLAALGLLVVAVMALVWRSSRHAGEGYKEATEEVELVH